MSVVTQRKVSRTAAIVAGLILMSGVAACGRSDDTPADSRAPEPAAASVPSASEADAPLGESTRSADAAAPAEIPTPIGNSTMQTAEAAAPGTVKAAKPDTGGDDTDKSTPSLSAEQQELAAEVGDTRHVSAQVASDKAPSDKAPD